MDLLNGYRSSSSDDDDNDKDDKGEDKDERVEGKGENTTHIPPSPSIPSRFQANGPPPLTNAKAPASLSLSSSSSEPSPRYRLHRGHGVDAAPRPPPMPSSSSSFSRMIVLESRGGVGGGNGGLRHGTVSSTTRGGSLLLMNNPLKRHLMAPMAGPTREDDVDDGGGVGSSSLSRGAVGEATHGAAFDETTFHRERTRFQREGRALGPDEKGTEVTEEAGLVGWGEKAGKARRVGRTRNGRGRRVDDDGGAGAGADGNDGNEDGEEGGSEKDDAEESGADGDGEGAPKSRRKRRRASPSPLSPSSKEYVRDSDDEATYGIWGPPTKEERAHRLDEESDVARGIELAPQQLAEREYIKERDRQRGKLNEDGDAAATGASEAEKFDRMVERKMSHLLPPRMEGDDPSAVEPRTTFHGPEEFDYRGRSWIEPPPGSGAGADRGDVEHHSCYVPKKCVGRLTGHNKGVHRIRLFPRTGHLILSGGLDGKCKVWSLSTKRVMRTYVGHAAAVRDVAFSNDGTRFLSASFDRFVRMWNTESGEVLGTYTNRRVPYVVKFYPHDDNIFVVGCSDNKIVAYDSKTGEITQEYNHHLAPVNTVTFVDDPRGGGGTTKMITSSDDKKVLVWEWDIGVPIKYISDPTMHSMPSVTLHPSGQYWLGSGLDNTVTVYQSTDRFALQRKKKFTGHAVAGYACDLDVSPDGRFVASGDGEGKLHVWDWRRGKSLAKFRAHDGGPATGCVWHPVEPSTVITCGWDGIIKIWQ